jgi:hypothetical protein
MAQRYPEARRGRCGARLAGAVGKKHLTGGAQMSAMEREKALRMQCVKSRRKRISQNRPTTLGPSGCEASGPGSRWLGGLGRPAGQGRWGLAGPAEAEAQWGEESGRLKKKEMGHG